jgi:hypothetical protein
VVDRCVSQAGDGAINSRPGKAWRLQGEVVPATQKDPESWGPADKFTVVLETAGFNAAEIGTYCRKQGLFSKQLLFFIIESF